MCGRFVVAHTGIELAAHYKTNNQDFEFSPSFNIAPTQLVPVVVSTSKDFLNPELHLARWGLIPSWSKEIPKVAMFNARIETLLEKPSFRDAALLNRCIVPASGYYEWQQADRKIPTYISTAELINLAGIFSWWKNLDGEFVLSVSILTKPSSKNLAQIHPRNPVFIPAQMTQSWLDRSISTSREVLNSLSEASDTVASNLGFHEVSSRVGAVKNNDPGLILELKN